LFHQIATATPDFKALNDGEFVLKPSISFADEKYSNMIHGIRAGNSMVMSVGKSVVNIKRWPFTIMFEPENLAENLAEKRLE
jgi:hypothetical protein